MIDRILDLDRDGLLRIADACSTGGRWWCGVSSSARKAREIGVKRDDLATLTVACWDAIASQGCAGQAREMYRGVACEMLCAVPQERRQILLKWALGEA